MGIRASYVHMHDLCVTALDSTRHGDIAEFGVWRGHTFMPLAEQARRYGRVAHAVDSFVGMAPPTDRDGKEYPKGTLSVGGSAAFRDNVSQYGQYVEVWEGFVPQILDGMGGLRFAFAHVDLDQYQPTMDVLKWLWSRMVDGGVVICHDWQPGKAILASAAIEDWMRETGVALAGQSSYSCHGWFRK